MDALRRGGEECAVGFVPSDRILLPPVDREGMHLSYDACEMFDVDAVEAMLVRSRLFQRCPTLQAFQEGDVSNLAADAGPINGTYCRRYRDAAVATRASFNENPWELMRNNNR